jgi:hypothetical protein
VSSLEGENGVWYYEISHFHTMIVMLIIIILPWLKIGADNIFTLKQWCSNNFPQAKEQLQNMYQEVSHFSLIPQSAIPVFNS